ncbi:MAG: MFS transporter [Halodesulfurarchaeum sp.]
MAPGKRLLVVSTFVPHFLMHALISALPLFVPIWLAEFAVSRATIGATMGGLYVFFGGAAIPVGILADRYGSVPFLEVFLFGSAVGTLVLGLTGSYVGLVGALLLIGVAGGLYHPPAFRLLSRQSYASSGLFAYHNIGGNLGLGVGPLLTALLLTAIDWRTAMLVGALVFGVVGVLFHVFGPDREVPDRTDGGEDPLAGRLRGIFTGGFVFVLLIYLLQGIYHRGVVVFIPDYLTKVSTVGALSIANRTLPPSQWVYSLMLMVGVGGQLFGGSVDERVRSTSLIGVQLIVMAGLIAMLGRTRGRVLLAVIALYGFTMSVVSPVLQNLVARHSADTDRGLAYGFTSAGGTATGGLIGASLAGWLATVSTYPAMFGTLALVPLLAVAVLLAFIDRS